jgi:hypothetical protein
MHANSRKKKAYYLICLAFFLTGCIYPARSLSASAVPLSRPPTAVDSTLSPSTADYQAEISRYYGQPDAALLLVDQGKQRSGIGNAAWTKSKTGDVRVFYYGDVFGVVTPAQPIDVASPFTATLVLPIHLPPSRLGYTLYPVAEEDSRGQGERQFKTWGLPYQPMKALPLETRQEIVFDPPTEGLHVLLVEAAWEDLGSVEYGFLLKIYSDSSTKQSLRLPPYWSAATAFLFSKDRSVRHLSATQFGIVQLFHGDDCIDQTSTIKASTS